MNRRLVWWGFSIGVIGMLVILGAVSVKLVAFEARHREELAERENRRRLDLALFRMESVTAPILARENGRPYFHYRASFPTKEPYRAYEGVLAAAGVAVSTSPLASGPPAFVRHYFEVSPAGVVTCVGAAESDGQAFVAQHRETFAACAPVVVTVAQDVAWGAVGGAKTDGSMAREWQIRRESRVEQAVAQKIGSGLRESSIRIVEGVMRPAWVGDELALVRNVEINGVTWVQGAVLDWPALKTRLQDAVVDLLPSVQLKPLADDAATEAEGNRLAALPVSVWPQARVVPIDDPNGGVGAWLAFVWRWCPSLIVLWGTGLALAMGLWALLRAMLRLQDRQAAFAATVTHELRTPLTSLRMYVEMYRAGMLQDPQRLASYLETLDVESGRLVHLVENVLAYAQLDQGRASVRLKTLTVAELWTEAGDRAAAHAKQAGIQVAFQCADEAATVCTDPAAVEQILFNLIDNACKYGRSDRSPGIVVTAAIAGSWLEISVRDFGPGVPSNFRRRLFDSFARAGEVAATDAPGIGLGLALCQRLAKSLRGSLTWEEAADCGASFCLRLPLVP